MINTLLVAAATQIFLKKDSSFIVTEGIGDNNTNSDWLLGNHILELPVGHVSGLNEPSVLEDRLGLIELASCTLHSSVWVVSLRHHTILGGISVTL